MDFFIPPPTIFSRARNRKLKNKALLLIKTQNEKNYSEHLDILHFRIEPKLKMTGETPEVRSDKRKPREVGQTDSDRPSETVTDSHQRIRVIHHCHQGPQGHQGHVPKMSLK